MQYMSEVTSVSWQEVSRESIHLSDSQGCWGNWKVRDMAMSVMILKNQTGGLAPIRDWNSFSPWCPVSFY